jgi:hypothetical protein
MPGSVILLVASLYAKAIETVVEGRFIGFSQLVWIIGEINSEGRL